MDTLKFNSKHKTFEEQLNIFEKRGIQIEDRSSALERIKTINYYKIKEFSIPFIEKTDANGEIIYKKGTSFNNITNRFYEDKNLRVNFLRIIEKFEISIKTQFAHILGSKYGAFGYLKFQKWVDRDKYCKYYIELKEKEFKKRLFANIKRSKNIMVKQYLENNKGELPIWLTIEIMTFGEILDLYNLMSKNNKRAITGFYSLNPLTFESWSENLKLVRNMSAHNSNMVDFRFITKPVTKDNWDEKLLCQIDKNGKKIYTNRIAITIMILEEIILKINTKYPGGAIRKILRKLANKTDEGANLLGFKDFESINKLNI